MLNRRRFLKTASAFGAGALAPFGNVMAQENKWPSHTIRLIVPSSPGSGSDIVSRVFGRYLQAQIKQSVYVDDRPGGNTIIGTEDAKNAPPDGYTFFCSSASTHSANPALYSKLPFNPERDFVEIGLFGTYPYLAVVRKDSPYHSISELIDAARAKPGKISFGYGASSSQVPGELLKARANINILTVPYRAAPQVMNDIASGVIDFAIIPGMSGMQGMHNGLLKPIGVTSADRSKELPGVETFVEAIPGFVYEGWIGLSAPKKTPTPIIERMNGYLRESMNDPAMRHILGELGIVPHPTTLAEQSAFVAADRRNFVEMVRVAKVPLLN
jgi:tripartite-type tricarboxylate transporter receptor subunit TctC